MQYINKECIEKIGVNWERHINQIEKAIYCLQVGDYSQPIKPYLRYRNEINRIIAMPSFIGGDFDVAGIKWIASYPNNVKNGKPRAHSTVILNHSETGEPIAIINTALLSTIRTAAVSGLILKHYDKARNLENFKVGIIGWGPIGQYHYKMLSGLYGDKITDIYLYDISQINKNDTVINDNPKVHIVNSWEEAYSQSDVFITCTVANEPYIDKEPKKGALLLNVSLRDFKVDIMDYVKNNIFVDDWDEVCRENTDIENMHRNKGLKKEHTKTIIDIICHDGLSSDTSDTIMFNPMGMSVFDMAVAKHFFDESLRLKLGQRLD